MTEMHKHLGHAKHDELDSMLDAALAKYAAAEPRSGLEDRVLANLRAERARVPDRAWWRWSVSGALAAVIVVAVLAWRSSKTSHPVVENRPSATTQSTPTSAQVSSNPEKQIRKDPDRSPRFVAARRASMHRSQPKVVIAGNPKLDQFPSPQPLSEQEKILASYVEKYPEQAVLLARARTEALRQDQLEEMKAFPSGSRATDSEEGNSDSTER